MVFMKISVPKKKMEVKLVDTAYVRLGWWEEGMLLEKSQFTVSIGKNISQDSHLMPSTDKGLYEHKR